MVRPGQVERRQEVVDKLKPAPSWADERANDSVPCERRRAGQAGRYRSGARAAGRTGK